MRGQRCLGMEQSNRLAPRFTGSAEDSRGCPASLSQQEQMQGLLYRPQQLFPLVKGKGETEKRCLYQAPFWCPGQGSVTLSRAGHILHSFIHSFIHVNISERLVCDYLTFPVGRGKNETSFILPMKVSSTDIFFVSY